MTFEQFLDGVYFAQTQYERALADADADATYKKMKLRERMEAETLRISTNPDYMDEILARKYESDISSVNSAWNVAVGKAALAREQRLRLIYEILTGENA